MRFLVSGVESYDFGCFISKLPVGPPFLSADMEYALGLQFDQQHRGKEDIIAHISRLLFDLLSDICVVEPEALFSHPATVRKFAAIGLGAAALLGAVGKKIIAQ